MSNLERAQMDVDQILADLLEITMAELHKRRAAYHFCPECGGVTVGIFSTQKPIGPTGIYKCLVCDWIFDLTFQVQS